MLVKANRPYIFLESWAFPGRPDKVNEALRFLTDLDYRLYLPGWAQSDGSFFIGIGPVHEMETFGLIPFTLQDRLTIPSNPINILACPKDREASLGTPWSAARGRGFTLD